MEKLKLSFSSSSTISIVSYMADVTPTMSQMSEFESSPPPRSIIQNESVVTLFSISLFRISKLIDTTKTIESPIVETKCVCMIF